MEEKRDPSHAINFVVIAGVLITIGFVIHNYGSNGLVPAPPTATNEQSADPVVQEGDQLAQTILKKLTGTWKVPEHIYFNGRVLNEADRWFWQSKELGLWYSTRKGETWTFFGDGRFKLKGGDSGTVIAGTFWLHDDALTVRTAGGNMYRDGRLQFVDTGDCYFMHTTCFLHATEPKITTFGVTRVHLVPQDEDE